MRTHSPPKRLIRKDLSSWASNLSGAPPAGTVPEEHPELPPGTQAERGKDMKPVECRGILFTSNGTGNRRPDRELCTQGTEALSPPGEHAREKQKLQTSLMSPIRAGIYQLPDKEYRSAVSHWRSLRGTPAKDSAVRNCTKSRSQVYQISPQGA